MSGAYIISTAQAILYSENEFPQDLVGYSIVLRTCLEAKQEDAACWLQSYPDTQAWRQHLTWSWSVSLLQLFGSSRDRSLAHCKCHHFCDLLLKTGQGQRDDFACCYMLTASCPYFMLTIRIIIVMTKLEGLLTIYQDTAFTLVFDT